MLQDSDTVKLNICCSLTCTLFSLTSRGKLIKKLGFQEEAEPSVLSVKKGVIDNLDVSLVLNIFKFVSWKSHNCSSFLSIKVNKDRFWNICKFRWQHISRHTILIGFITIGATPTYTFFNYFSFTIIFGTCQIICLVIIF